MDTGHVNRNTSEYDDIDFSPGLNGSVFLISYKTIQCSGWFPEANSATLLSSWGPSSHSASKDSSYGKSVKLQRSLSFR